MQIAFWSRDYRELRYDTPSEDGICLGTCGNDGLSDVVERNPKLFPHDDVIKWKHFPRNWPFVRGIHRSPVNSPHKGQWRGALMFSFICVRINDWVNNREAGDLRRYCAHYDVIVMRVVNIMVNIDSLIHWLLRYIAVILLTLQICVFINCKEVILEWMQQHPPLWLVSIGFGNGLVPSGKKPLFEPMVTQICDVIDLWRH